MVTKKELKEQHERRLIRLTEEFLKKKRRSFTSRDIIERLKLDDVSPSGLTYILRKSPNLKSTKTYYGQFGRPRRYRFEWEYKHSNRYEMENNQFSNANNDISLNSDFHHHEEKESKTKSNKKDDPPAWCFGGCCLIIIIYIIVSLILNLL